MVIVLFKFKCEEKKDFHKSLEIKAFNFYAFILVL